MDARQSPPAPFRGAFGCGGINYIVCGHQSVGWCPVSCSILCCIWYPVPCCNWLTEPGYHLNHYHFSQNAGFGDVPEIFQKKHQNQHAHKAAPGLPPWTPGGPLGAPTAPKGPKLVPKWSQNASHFVLILAVIFDNFQRLGSKARNALPLQRELRSAHERTPEVDP